MRNKDFAKKKMAKGLVSKSVGQNRATKWIAQYFKVSQRTIYRRIKEYSLKGLRPEGKKPVPRKIPKIRKLRGRVLAKKYIDNLD